MRPSSHPRALGVPPQTTLVRSRKETNFCAVQCPPKNARSSRLNKRLPVFTRDYQPAIGTCVIVCWTRSTHLHSCPVVAGTPPLLLLVRAVLLLGVGVDFPCLAHDVHDIGARSVPQVLMVRRFDARPVVSRVVRPVDECAFSLGLMRAQELAVAQHEESASFGTRGAECDRLAYAFDMAYMVM